MPLAERLDTYVDGDLGASLARFPPGFEPVPCKPLFFDVALSVMPVPDVEARAKVWHVCVDVSILVCFDHRASAILVPYILLYANMIFKVVYIICMHVQTSSSAYAHKFLNIAIQEQASGISGFLSGVFGWGQR